MDTIKMSLLIKSLSETLTEQEEKELEQWLKESQEHRKFYRALQKEHAGEVKKECDKTTSLTKEHAKQRYSQNLDNLAKKQSRLLFFKIASAAATIVLAAGLLFFQLNDRHVNDYTLLAKVVPGTVKATLIKGNQEIMLTDTSAAYIANNVTVQTNAAVAAQGQVQPAAKATNSSPATNSNVANSPGTVASVADTQVVMIPKGGEYSMLLADGSIVRLSPKSTLRFPDQFIGATREVFLEGEACFEVTKGKQPFIVNTASSRVKVYGTKFIVEAYPGRVQHTILAEGSISVAKINSKEETFITPGQQATISGIAEPVLVNEIDIETAMAWQQGYFAFDDSALEVVMEKIGLWYNVNIEIKNKELKEKLISCRIGKFHPLGQVIKIIQHTTEMNFKYENNKLILY